MVTSDDRTLRLSEHFEMAIEQEDDQEEHIRLGRTQVEVYLLYNFIMSAHYDVHLCDLKKCHPPTISGINQFSIDQGEEQKVHAL